MILDLGRHELREGPRVLRLRRSEENMLFAIARKAEGIARRDSVLEEMYSADGKRLPQSGILSVLLSQLQRRTEEAGLPFPIERIPRVGLRAKNIEIVNKRGMLPARARADLTALMEQCRDEALADRCYDHLAAML